jgi:peptide/nickel transport system substrate-binding protein
MPKGGKDDPDMLGGVERHEQPADRGGRQAAFARMQKSRWSKVYAVPFGSFTKVQATRSNVKGFVPFRIPRMSNVWFQQ